MRTARVAVLVLAGCPAAQPTPPKRPNADLIAGAYERHKPDGETAIRFEAEAASTKQGTYKIVLSKIGVRFTKVTDSCERRSAYDGQTWWRVE